MPKKTKAAKNAKQRTEVKNLSNATTDLSAEEAKKVKGGVIAIIAPQTSSRLADGSLKQATNTLLPYIEKK